MGRVDDARRLMAVCVTLGAVAQILQVLTQIPPPPTVHMDIKRNMILLVSVLGQLLYLFTLLPPSSLETQLPLRDRLFYDFHGQGFRGRDVFSLIHRQQYLFWLNTGEAVESFLEIVYQTAPCFLMLTRRGNPRQRMGRFKLDVVNRILLVFIWLRKYPHLNTLALLFDVTPQTVCALLYQGISILWHHFNSAVSWPSLREWDVMRGTWQHLPNAVGCIDVMPHEILVLSDKPQCQFYSSHRHFRLLNTQMLCDNKGHIRFLQAGFLGSTHDSQSYRLMQPLGPGLALDVPAGVVFLADKGYPDNPPLLTPFRQAQTRRMNRIDK